MANNFIGMCYAIVKEAGYNTEEMTTKEVVEKFEELNGENKISNNNKLKNKDKIKTEKLTREQQLEKDVDAVLNGTYKDSHVLLMKETPEIFQKIGVPNKPFLITTKHVYTTINNEGIYKKENVHYHGLGKENFLHIPKLLEKPILIYQNFKDGKYGDIVAMINMVDSKQDIVIVPIKINGKGNINFIEVDANIIKSAHGRINIQNILDKLQPEQLLSVQSTVYNKMKK